MKPPITDQNTPWVNQDSERANENKIYQSPSTNFLVHPVQTHTHIYKHT